MDAVTQIKKKYIDWKLLLLLAGFYAFFDLVFIAKTAYMNYYGHMKMETTWPQFLINNLLLDYFLVVGFMSLIAMSTKRFLRKNYSWSKIICIHIFFSLAIGIFIRLFFDVYLNLIGHNTFDTPYLQSFVYKFMYVIDLNFLIYFAMVFIIYTYYYVREVKDSEKKQGALKAQLVNTRMKMLSSQLQPHFLFNTLNSITVLTEIDPSKARDTIADLSDLLREILYANESNKITLERELHILGFYLNIVLVRFSDHLKINIKVDDSLLLKKMPSLLLQPILENSIKHGYDYNHTELEVSVNIYAEGNTLLIVVENNGAALSAPFSQLLKQGVGLANIRDRLDNLYDQACSFNLTNKSDEQGVKTLIKIPLES